MADLASTGKVQRSDTRPDRSVVDGSRFRHGTITPAVPTPIVVPTPHGDLTRAPTARIVELAGRVWEANPRAASERRRQVGALLTHLRSGPGRSWQQRWEASTYHDGTLPRFGLPTDPAADARQAFKTLLCLRVLRPTLAATGCLFPAGFAELFRVAQHDPNLDAFFAHVEQIAASRRARSIAIFDVARALTIFGIRFAELTPAALLQYSWECRSNGMVTYYRGDRGTFAAKLAWIALVDMGHFPTGTPPTIRAAGQRGQHTVTELVDLYPLVNTEVRQLLIDYLTRRAMAMDYSSLRNLARWVVGVFWSRIEQIAPGIADLTIPAPVYDQWREAIKLRDDGRERLSVDPILLSVRSMYLDLHTWSVSEPERWARWVAPCPIRPGEFAGSARRDRRRQERSHQRTRVRQPLLPTLVAHVAARVAHHQHLLQAATGTPAGQRLTVTGHVYTRVWTDYDQQRRADNPIRVRDEATGGIVNAGLAEDSAFWDWALVEVLRLTGCRIEEALELTQLSIRRYLRPNGETIGLLVIAPSKTDRERVLPMSAELFAAIAAIVRRHQDRGDGTVPRLPRYDPYERTHSAPMPFLFQRRRGPTRYVIGQHTVLEMLDKRCADLAATHPEFGRARFTPHDFRRLFATDLVNNGLPIHIGAALLGHLNLETTRGYVAVFDEDVIRHYQTFLHHRRQTRPPEEYRPTTELEWQEFEQHFDKRKVELGNCGRPYGTPCAHEHSCIRCPMLHIHPDTLPRLDVIETDLHARRDRARDEGWHGEIEGIDLTLGHLHAKRQQALRLSVARTVSLGIPTIGPQPATR